MRWSCKQTNDTLLETLSRLIKWIKTNSFSAVIVFLPLFSFRALTELLSLTKCFCSTDEVSCQSRWGKWWTQWDESEWERLLQILVGDDSRACSSRIFTLEWCDNCWVWRWWFYSFPELCGSLPWPFLLQVHPSGIGGLQGALLEQQQF